MEDDCEYRNGSVTEAVGALVDGYGRGEEDPKVL
jgi:hypothetical protein